MRREALAHSGQSVRILGADTAVNRPPAVAIPIAASKPRSSTNSNTPLCCGSSPNRPHRVHYPGVRPPYALICRPAIWRRSAASQCTWPVALHRENRVRPIELTWSGSLNQWPLLPEVPKSGPCAEWQCDGRRPRTIGPPTQLVHPWLPPVEIADHTASGRRFISQQHNVTLTLLALREILTRWSPLQRRATAVCPDNLAPHTTTRRCRDGNHIERRTTRPLPPRPHAGERRRLLATSIP